MFERCALMQTPHFLEFGGAAFAQWRLGDEGLRPLSPPAPPSAFRGLRPRTPALPGAVLAPSAPSCTAARKPSDFGEALRPHPSSHACEEISGGRCGVTTGPATGERRERRGRNASPDAQRSPPPAETARTSFDELCSRAACAMRSSVMLALELLKLAVPRLGVSNA